MKLKLIYKLKLAFISLSILIIGLTFGDLYSDYKHAIEKQTRINEVVAFMESKKW